MSTLFGSEAGPIDYLCCDIFVQAGIGGNGNEWRAVTDPTILRAWVAKLFAFFSAKTEGFVWNREVLRLTGLSVALGAVVNAVAPTLAPPAAEKAAFARLEEYPAKIGQSVHRARCKLPVLVAHALALHPQLIAAAVELFYSCDQLQLKRCQTMDVFPPEPCVMTTVLFNRVQYAKLASQNIRAPAIFDLPPAQSPEYKASVLGMKVACGFEMLSHEGLRLAARKDTQTRGAKNNLNQETTPDSFLEPLGEAGYFGQMSVTSDGYTKRRAYAEQYFKESQVCGPGTPMSIDALMSQASQSLSAAIASARDGSALLTVSALIAGKEDEDDSWLALDPAELDNVMRNAESILRDATQDDHDQQTAESNGYTGSGDDAAAADLQQVLEKFEAFLMSDSGLEGAEFLNDHSDYDEVAEGSDEDLDWDADGVIEALMKAIGVEGQEDTKNASKCQVTSPEERMEDAPKTSDSDGEDATVAAAMQAMDQELSATHVGKSFASVQQSQTTHEHPNGGHEDELGDVTDVNVDLNLVQNIVESFRAQEGLPGPAGTLLGQFGIHLPQIDSESDGESSH
ncbi:hypothetical protein IWW37_000104 [Coemansia sp. RSA 2050]|nr:hypothetical protein IWW37_000104 [Coemansia sp. RSA 2050]